jgi:hypothetical protein
VWHRGCQVGSRCWDPTGNTRQCLDLRWGGLGVRVEQQSLNLLLFAALLGALAVVAGSGCVVGTKALLSALCRVPRSSRRRKGSVVYAKVSSSEHEAEHEEGEGEGLELAPARSEDRCDYDHSTLPEVTEHDASSYVEEGHMATIPLSG